MGDGGNNTLEAARLPSEYPYYIKEESLDTSNFNLSRRQKNLP